MMQMYINSKEKISNLCGNSKIDFENMTTRIKNTLIVELHTTNKYLTTY